MSIEHVVEEALALLCCLWKYIDRWVEHAMAYNCILVFCWWCGEKRDILELFILHRNLLKSWIFVRWTRPKHSI